MARTVPRPFEMPWGKGEVVEEVTGSNEWHEPVIQLLRYEDGTESIRFCSYSHRGAFQRQPLIVTVEDLPVLREALAEAPRLSELLAALVR